jgi:hypothetical protein
MAKRSDQIYDAAPELVFEALCRAVVALGYEIQSVDNRTNTLFFKKRKQFSGTALSDVEGKTKLSLAPTAGVAGELHKQVAAELTNPTSQDLVAASEESGATARVDTDPERPRSSPLEAEPSSEAEDDLGSVSDTQSAVRVSSSEDEPVVETSLDRPYIGSSVTPNDVAKCLELIELVLDPNEAALAVFRASAFSFTYLVITSDRVLALDRAYAKSPEKAQKQVIQRRQISKVASRVKGATARLLIETTDQTSEEYGGLAILEIEEIVALVEAVSTPEKATELHVARSEREAARTDWEEAFANVPTHGEGVNKPTRKEIAANCRDGELPRFIIGSSAAGALAAFDDRCLLVKKGVMTTFMAGSLGGGRATTFLYSEITGIEYNSGLTTGVLEILTASYSGTSNKDFWRGTLSGRNANSDDPYTLSNTLPLAKVVYERVRPQVEELKRLIAESKRPHIVIQAPEHAEVPAPRVADTTLASELERLAELRERGLLDDEEFKAAKLALIDRF